MKRIGFNEGWLFQLENHIDEFNTFGFSKYGNAAGAPGRFYDFCNWEKVTLPHDWAIALQKDRAANPFAGGYPNTRYHRFMMERHANLEAVYHVGWYRKQFAYDPAWAGKRVFIEFEGVFRDAVVWCNGVYLDRHTSGYTGFALEITEHLVPGEENAIAVRADSMHPEGWWYEGAGIYRPVNLLIGESVYIKRCKTAIITRLDGGVDVSCVLVNDTGEAASSGVRFTIRDGEGREAAAQTVQAQIAPHGEAEIRAQLHIRNPKLWSVASPYLYTLEIAVGEETEETSFGVRAVGFDADRGFLLNGEALKIRGMDMHQDFGGVGVAVPPNLEAYRVELLKQMGANALRMHHAPSAALLDACDRMGFLVMDETRMFGTGPEALRQMTDIIERDRNHPSVFIWSMGNEEFSVQDSAWSYRLMEKMTRICKALDPTRPVTYAGNNGMNATGANGAAEVRGVNYIRNGENGHWLDEYHRQHPAQPIIGTEEGSYVLSRGGAVNALETGQLDALGDVTMPWGSTPKGWVKFVEERGYLAGSFLWTGFDYRGEPNPFYYANTSSSFGTIDLCGMEKPPYHYYRAWWTDEPVLKIAPHWNHNHGDMVRIGVFTNCESVTLTLNGRQVGKKAVERFDAPVFDIPFEPGVLRAEGVFNGKILRDELVTAAKTAQLRITQVLEAKSAADAAICQIEAYDENGVFCPLADDAVQLRIENGRIIGVGNGDPACMDPEQISPREEAVYLREFACGGEAFIIPPKEPNRLYKRHDWLELETFAEGYEDDYRIVAKFGHNLKKPVEQTYTARVSGVEGFEYVEFERLGSVCDVYVNGEKIGDTRRSFGRQANNAIRPYRFPCAFKAGENEICVVAVHEECDPPAISGYVKIGRLMPADWQVRLHYGKARVLVTSDTPQDVRLHAKQMENR